MRKKEIERKIVYVGRLAVGVFKNWDFLDNSRMDVTRVF